MSAGGRGLKNVWCISCSAGRFVTSGSLIRLRCDKGDRAGRQNNQGRDPRDFSRSPCQAKMGLWRVRHKLLRKSNESARTTSYLCTMLDSKMILQTRIECVVVPSLLWPPWQVPRQSILVVWSCSVASGMLTMQEDDYFDPFDNDFGDFDADYDYLDAHMDQDSSPPPIADPLPCSASAQSHLYENYTQSLREGIGLGASGKPSLAN